MGKCTWKNCNNTAEFPQIGKDKSQWANLCNEHQKELDEAIIPNNPKGILRVWVLAQGGSRKATKNSMGK